MTAAPSTSLAFRPLLLALDVVALVGMATLALVIVQDAMLQRAPELLGTAVFVDLTLTAALVHSFVGVRWGQLPRWTVLPVAAAGLAAAYVIVPTSAHPSGHLLMVLGGAIEFGLIVLATLRLRRFIKGYRASRMDGDNRFAAVERGFLRVLPQVPAAAAFVRLECELWSYFLTGWFRRAPAGPMLTHHKKPQWSAIAGTLAFLSLIEGSLVHLLLIKNGYETAAWISLGVHLYGLVWVFGDAHALRLRPSRLVEHEGETRVELNVGVRASARFARDAVAGVDVIDEEEAMPSDVSIGRAVVFGRPNLRITLRQAVPFRAVFRGTRPVRVLLLQVDDPMQWHSVLATDA